MKTNVIFTNDGSTSMFVPSLNETYHSKHGAIQEAYHVFIKNGLNLVNKKSVSILEIGFGTGLNAFITFIEAESKLLNVKYTTIEAYPVEIENALKMNFVKLLNTEKSDIFNELHTCKWEVNHSISENFEFTKHQQFFEDINFVINLI